jgi:hypothetical protein
MGEGEFLVFWRTIQGNRQFTRRYGFCSPLCVDLDSTSAADRLVEYTALLPFGS